jgi:hypothetical protein
MYYLRQKGNQIHRGKNGQIRRHGRVHHTSDARSNASTNLLARGLSILRAPLKDNQFNASTAWSKQTRRLSICSFGKRLSIPIVSRGKILTLSLIFFRLSSCPSPLDTRDYLLCGITCVNPAIETDGASNLPPERLGNGGDGVNVKGGCPYI